jgi:hypothetical protein
LNWKIRKYMLLFGSRYNLRLGVWF